ncbi:hypothetical protein [Cohnella rhizosphaerae]|uniref:Uncharacterized protein n=1 Tax=Cohnella rhizosphaerae TaxID=1457232 RepID=A0A9X4QWV3_9BACL|nr:hypothetical protein [Cohnella rhizosphaerae]MDG0814195.1 hypothetical protein [Cohnella rhizosphaerae]
MMERVHLLSGTVTIGEAAQGIGCRLRIMLPLEDSDDRLPELPA